MTENIQPSSNNDIHELINIVSKLRDPVGGCPWDLNQTNNSLIPYLLEETHEVANAIREEDDTSLCEELGDLLLQIILHSQISSESNRFTFEDVVNDICKKLIRRHPHVFEKKQNITYEEVRNNWEQIKMKEKPLNNTQTPLTDRLKTKIRSLSALAGAMNISSKVAKAGFEWESIDKVWEKVEEEIEELKYALKNKNYINAENELGDVLFSLLNVARWYNLNPEEGLTNTNKIFLNRFQHLESKFNGEFSNKSPSSLKKTWEEAKKLVNKNK